MPANRIQFHYEEITALRDRFTRQADAVNQMTQAVRSKYDALQGGGWIGRGANAFFQEMDSAVFPALTRLYGALTQAASELQRMSDQAHDVEEQAANLFRRIGG